MTKEFGRRMYISGDKRKDYATKMRSITNRAVHNAVVEKWSEFEKPYREPDYNAMQHFNPKGYRIPYRGPEPDTNPIGDSPIESGQRCQVFAETTPAFINCQEKGGQITSKLTLKSINLRDTFPAIWRLGAGGKGSIRGDIYYAPRCDDVVNPSGVRCGSILDVVIGMREDGCEDDTTIRINALDDECVGVCNIPIGNSITSDGADPNLPADGDEYSVPGVGDQDIEWSISTGSITNGGVITVTGACGTATITAKMCSETVTLDVRMPDDSHWVQGSTDTHCAGASGPIEATCIIGGVRYDETYRTTGQASGCDCGAADPVTPCPDCCPGTSGGCPLQCTSPSCGDNMCFCQGGACQCRYHTRTTPYTWECI